MFQKITLDLVENLSSAKTYIRGEDYYKSGAVRKIKYHENKNSITSAVRGRRNYTVTIYNVSEGPQFTCTCPMEALNICKHGVALALEIIHNPDTVEIEKPGEPTKETEIDTVLEKASDDQKEKFLIEVLKENSTYKDKFRTLILGQTAVETGNSVEEIRDYIKEELEAFDLTDYERFYDSYNQSYGYKDEWEVLYDGAMEEVNEMMDGFAESIKEHLKSGNIVEASKELLGFYEGISVMDEDEMEDEAHIFEDGLLGELLYIYFDFLKEFVELFRAVDKNEYALLRISEITVERVRYYQQNLSQYDEFEYNLSEFKPFLKALVCSSKTAQYWDSALGKLNLKDNTTDEVQLKIAEQLEDKENWLKTAERTFKFNPAVTEQLLHFYKQQGDSDNLIRVGKFALATWADKFDRCLYENLEKEKDPDFFADILFHYAKREKSIPLFREYKKIFGQKSAGSFIDKLKDEWSHKLYYIKLLEEDKDFSTILEYVKNNVDDWDFVKYIKPVINVYPGECFKIIREKTNDVLENTTGRSIYHGAAQWLKLLLKVEDKETGEKIQRYFDSLFQTYNRR